MSGSLKMTATCVFAALCLGMGALAASTTGVVAEEMTFVERATSDAVTDTGAKGDSAGDILTFNNEIYDAANASKLGTDNGWCVRTVPGKAWECFWTLSVEKGQITVEGPFNDGQDSILAVTGGTGAFAGARGEMALHARDAQGTSFDFRYKLN
jgi:allene oxide cyclase